MILRVLRARSRPACPGPSGRGSLGPASGSALTASVTGSLRGPRAPVVTGKKPGHRDAAAYCASGSLSFEPESEIAARAPAGPGGSPLSEIQPRRAAGCPQAACYVSCSDSESAAVHSAGDSESAGSGFATEWTRAHWQFHSQG